MGALKHPTLLKFIFGSTLLQLAIKSLVCDEHK